MTMEGRKRFFLLENRPVDLGKLRVIVWRREDVRVSGWVVLEGRTAFAMTRGPLRCGSRCYVSSDTGSKSGVCGLGKTFR